MAQENSAVRERQQIHSGTPRLYNVVMHNDDFTPMEFVVMVLVNVFFRSEQEATSLMLDVHHKGSGIAGTYSYDIALSKAARATAMAKEEEFPFRLTVEPAD